MSENAYNLLLLEDHKELHDQIKEIAEEVGFKVRGARSVEGADEILKAEETSIDACSIDVMVPKEESSLNELDKLIEERESYLSDEDVDPLTLYQKLAAHDERISYLVDEVGGIRFLSEIASRKGSDFLKSRTIVISARTPSTEDICEEFGSLDPSTQLLQWVPKPARSRRIREVLTLLYGNVKTDS